MEWKKIGLFLLSCTTLVFFLSTLLFALAYSGAEMDAQRYRETLQNKNSTIQEYREILEEANQTLKKREQRLKELEESNERMRESLNQARLFTSTPSWYLQEDGEIKTSFTLYNFGNNSAREISADFLIYESSDASQPKEEIKLDLGNIAGNSMLSRSYELNHESGINSDDTASVVIRSCENCRVLWRNIPTLSDSLSDQNSAENSDDGDSSSL